MSNISEEIVPKTIVIFRKERLGNIVALFPGKKADMTPYNYSCYSHIGQHSACNPGYIRQTTPCTPQEYKDLKEELESIGYNLDIKQKVMYSDCHWSNKISLEGIK